MGAQPIESTKKPFEKQFANRSVDKREEQKQSQNK